MIGVRVSGDTRVIAAEMAELPGVIYVVSTAGSFDLLVEVVCESDDDLIDLLNDRIRSLPVRGGDRDVRVLETPPTALQLGNAMTLHEIDMQTDLQAKARDHLWMHSARQSVMTEGPGVPIIVKGEGHHIWDPPASATSTASRACSSSNAGHGRRRIAQAAAKQAEELAFFPLWSYAHPAAIELADRIAHLAPATSTTSSSPPVRRGRRDGVQARQAVLEDAGQAHQAQGDSPARSPTTAPRRVALAITGLPVMKHMFEPVTPGGFRVPNTNYYRAAESGFGGGTPEEFGLWAADRIEQMIQFEGPETVAAVFLEPVQNAGGCFPAPAGYFQRVREICDKYDVLLVSDEVICAFGRLGYYFGAEAYDYQPDMITFAKAVTSGYSPLGGNIVSDRVYEPFAHGDASFPHGYTFGGHPVSSAVAMENLDVFEEEGCWRTSRTNSPVFRSTLRSCSTAHRRGRPRRRLLLRHRARQGQDHQGDLDDDESERLLRGFLSKALYDAGLYCRADDRGDPVIQLAPPLTIGPSEFDEIEQILRSTLTEAWTRL